MRSKRFFEWRRRRKRELRKQLFKLLGEVCSNCKTTEQLEFDLKEPKLDDKHHRMNSYQRICFYWKEHERDNVQVLCHSCNGRKGLNERYTTGPF